jgi:hypothetical protein
MNTSTIVLVAVLVVMVVLYVARRRTRLSREEMD